MPWVRKFPWRGDSLPTSVVLDFPGGSAGKESTCKAGDLGLMPYHPKGYKENTKCI